jgi:hypothetical protein
VHRSRRQHPFAAVRFTLPGGPLNREKTNRLSARKVTVGIVLAKLQECSTVLTAGGFEPQPVNAETTPDPILRALASKESGPPPRKLDAAALAALIASTQAGIPLPDRNPNR